MQLEKHDLVLETYKKLKPNHTIAPTIKFTMPNSTPCSLLLVESLFLCSDIELKRRIAIKNYLIPFVFFNFLSSQTEKEEKSNRKTESNEPILDRRGTTARIAQRTRPRK